MDKTVKFMDKTIIFHRQIKRITLSAIAGITLMTVSSASAPPFPADTASNAIAQATSIAQTPQTHQSQDIVLEWNTLIVAAIRTDRTAAPMAARNLAIVHTAIYDAVNSISRTHQPYRVRVDVPSDTSKVAAAAAAAHHALVSLYPNQQQTFDAALTATLANIPDGQAKSQGIELGDTVAEQMLNERMNDGAIAIATYTPLTQIGAWQPVPPDFGAASMPQWKDVKPFAMTSASQFRPPGYSDLTSSQYVEEFNYTLQIGAKDSTTRTADQTTIAQFWLDGNGTATPFGHWNQIVAAIAQHQGNSLETNARLFALLNIALADATIVDADAKYTFHRWRPITAIWQADRDNNPATIANPNWTPLLPTPSSPAYTSGHSTCGGVADAVLTTLLGGNVPFTVSADPTLSLEARSFNSFREAAEEQGMSRVYGGVHWLSDNRDGLAAGRKLGQYVVENFLL
jgi:hypothetical protein